MEAEDISRIHLTILGFLNQHEENIVKPNERDYTGIIRTHTRSTWELRDQINNFFDEEMQKVKNDTYE